MFNSKIPSRLTTFRLESEWIVFCLYILLAILLYSQMLYSDYLFYDDAATINDNPSLHNLSDWGAIFKSFNTRFLLGLTLAFNYLIGGTLPYWYRLTNILIHGTTAFAIYLTLREIGRLMQTKTNQPIYFNDKLICFIGATIFLAHPLVTDALNQIVQRMEMMATLFYVATIFLYLRYRKTNNRLAALAAWITCVASMFCKEISFTLPFMIYIFDVFFFASNIKTRFLKWLPFGLTLLIIPSVLLLTRPDTMLPTTQIAAVKNIDILHHNKEYLLDITRAGGTEQIKRKDYFLTELNVMRTYWRLLFYPVNQMFLYHYPLSQSLFEWQTMRSAILHLLLILWMFYLFRKRQVLSLGIIWFYLTLSVESTILPIAHVISEYRVYMAIFGFVLILLSVANIFCLKRLMTICLLSFLVLALSGVTSARNVIWLDEKTLWRDNLNKAQYNVLVYHSYALVLLGKKDYEQAEKALRFLVKAFPQYELPYYNLSTHYLNQKKYDDLEKLFVDYQRQFGENYSLFFLKGQYYFSLKNYSRAIAYLKQAIKHNPKKPDSYMLLCASYAQFDKIAEEQCYWKATKKVPYEIYFYTRLVIMYKTSHDQQKTEEVWAVLKETPYERYKKSIEEALSKFNITDDGFISNLTPAK